MLMHIIIEAAVVAMELRKLKTGDIVVVKTMRSPYRGQTGEVEGHTPSGQSVYVRLRDGRRPTLRVTSLRVVGQRKEGKEKAGSAGLERDRRLEEVMDELRKLRVEVAELKVWCWAQVK